VGGGGWWREICCVRISPPLLLKKAFSKLINITLKILIHKSNHGEKSMSGYPNPTIHNTSIYELPKIHCYPYEHPWFLDDSLQLSMQVWISKLISKQGYPFKDNLQWIAVEHEYPRMDIDVLCISVWFYPCSFGYPLIFVDILAWTCYGFSIQGIFRAIILMRFPIIPRVLSFLFLFASQRKN